MRRRVVACALTFATLLVLPANPTGPVIVAHAEPSDTADPPGTSDVRLAWPALGLEPEMYLGPNASTSFPIPVPDGLFPVRVQGLVHAPMNIDGGYLEISDVDGRFLAAVDLPPAMSTQAVTPIDVDISAVQVRSSTADLSFTVRAVEDADQFCGPLQQVLVSDMATVFTGTETPASTISDFFPPILDRVTIYAPADADAAEQQSVLMLVSTLARLYDPQPLPITVVSQPRGAAPPPAPQRARAIAVESGGAAGLTVENAGNPGSYLRLSGNGDELSTQVSLLVNQLQTLVQVPTSRVDQAGSDPAPNGDTLTFAQLNLSGRADVLRRNSLSVGVDRAALGNGRFDSVQVHLLADYTPVPAADAASVVIRSGENVVYSAALDNSGRLDATFDLDSQILSQDISLAFALTYTPAQTCGPLIAPITFQIDPQSTLTMHRGGPPLGGFSALPSEFTPGFLVALDGSDPNQLVYAARVVSSIARLTSAQLMPQVVDLSTAADATTGALIVADSEAVAKTSLNPPLGGEGTTVDIGLPTELRAEIDGGLGSIQAFADRPRNRSVVLVTTTGAWPLVDPLFDYINQLDVGWSALNGDVLAAGAEGTPANLAVRAEADASEAPAPKEPTRHWLPIGIALGVVAVLAVGGAVLWSSRRRNS